MRTILLNGSPKGNTKNCGSYFLAKAFVSGMKAPCEIRAIETEDQDALLSYLQGFKQIILIAPNYIHAVSGGTLDFLYHLPPAKPGQSLGFILQSGYPESAESGIISRFLKQHATRLGYGCLGTVIKGECAGLAIMPHMFKKLEAQFSQFGALYEQTGRFDPDLIKEFAQPYTLHPLKCWILNATNPIGNSLGWHKIMRKNQAYINRLDTPYLDLPEKS